MKYKYFCDPFFCLQLFLSSDKATFSKCAKKSRHNEVSLVRGVSFLNQWKITAFDSEYRLEMESAPVPVSYQTVAN